MNDTHHQVVDARETALVSEILRDSAFLNEFPQFNPNDFRNELWALVAATAHRQHLAGQKPEMVSVVEELDRGGVLSERCGPDAVPRIISLAQYPLSSHPVELARQIHQEAQRRRLRLKLEVLIGGIDDPTVSSDYLSKQLTGAAELLGDQWSGIESMSSAELEAGQFDQSYLVSDVLASDQPCVLAAPKKCLKTNIAIDLTLSLASGDRFLGKFYVPQPVRVALISGESGAATIQETARRIARSKQWVHLNDYQNAFWSFSLPQLSDHRSLMALRQFIRRHQIKVLICDPAYLMLCLGDDAGNLFKVGPILWQLSKLGADEGVTIIIVHHTVKGVAVTDGPPELEGIAWSGFQEWARQWILLSRRAAYDTDRIGHHELWFTAGGSAGHSVGKALDIEEGDRRDTGGRRWLVEVKPIGEAIGAKVEAATTAKEQRQRAQHDKSVTNAVAKVLEALEANHEGLTQRRFKEEHGIRPLLLTAAIKQLSESKQVVKCQVTGDNGRPYDGWRLVKHAAGTSGNEREPCELFPLVPTETPAGTGTGLPI